MRYLGIDWGAAKMGLAISGGSLAAPLRVIGYKDENVLINKVLQVIEEENLQKIVIGISEKNSAEAAEEFAQRLSKKTNLEIIFQDETLSSNDARRMAIEAGIKQKKRLRMEDAYAATLILQCYLDSL